jgi:hypothetical protein
VSRSAFKEDAMVLPSSSTPLEQKLAESHQELLVELGNVRQELSSAKAALVTEITRAVNDLSTRQNADKKEILAEVRSKGEGKSFQVLQVILPSLLTVGLGLLVWFLQIGTNQRIDTNGKKIATALALRAESYKRKVAVYEDADKQMAALVGIMEDLQRDSKNPRKLKLVADTEAKLSEMSKVNGLYITKQVSDGLANVAYTAATMPTDLKGLTDQVHGVEEDMKKELESDFGSFGTEK